MVTCDNQTVIKTDALPVMLLVLGISTVKFLL